MEVGLPEDMWSPYKHLYKVIEQTIANPTGTSIAELDMCLKKYKQNFVTILRNPPRNERHRNQILNGLSDGIQIPGHSRPILLSKDLVDECIIISDMYELDEFIALELLCTAQRQMPQHPGLPRGLVAILLYYDGRKALTNALRDLFQITSGVSWVTDVPKELTNIVSAFTQSLVEDANILEKIIDLLGELDFTKESLDLTRNRAVGPKKHQNQVTELFEDIRLGLATALFYWSAQRGLSKTVVVKLMQSLYKCKDTDGNGLLQDTTLTMLMALLFAFDTSVLQRQEDHDLAVQDLPIMSETDFAQHIFEALSNMRDLNTAENEEPNRFSGIVKFAFALSLASLRHAPQNLQLAVARMIERDEQLMDEAISEKVFAFLYHNLLEKDIVYKVEFFYRRVHLLFADLIEFMHSKVTELRGRADETARTVMSFLKEGLEPPANLDHNFELLLLSIGKFYEGNRAGLSLCAEYWSPFDTNSGPIKTTTRSVSLFKFIRLAGELLPTTLFVPYLKMITGLTSCEGSARHAFNLLKQSGLSGSATLSWDHFFGSLSRYYNNLRHEQNPGSDTIYRSRVINRSINPQEIEGLQAVLGIIKAVATHEEMSRISLCEHPNWAPLQVLMGLLCCSVPLNLKASILQTLAALCKSKETAIPLWNTLEQSQIISTIPTVNTYTNCKIQIEIEQNECRLESYPLSQGVLDLFYSLITTALPRNLGGGPRKPGFTPYLNFIINDIFLKSYNRHYKNPGEKWQVAQKCLRILNYLLQIYEVTPEDFNEFKEEYPPPGYHINLQLHTKSEMLRLILLIIDESRKHLDEFNKFPGKEHMEQCALDCLHILERGLAQQDAYFEAHSIASSSVLLSGLKKILLDVNPTSRRPDHVLNTTKFITYWNWLPNHALSAIKILHIVSQQPNISSQLLGMITQTQQTHSEIRQGFVECLENELPTPAALQDEEDEQQDANNLNVAKIELKIKEAIIELLLDCLRQPAPNLTHFLLGFDPAHDINFSGFRHRPGVLETSNNCTKSLVSLLDAHLQLMKNSDVYCAEIERVIERSYCLLYALCSHSRISDTILRFLRTCNDFLSHHLMALPFRHYQQAYVLLQMSHLLKCAAIDLKLSATNCQISRFQHICNLMLGAVAKTPVNMSMDWNQYYASTHTAPAAFLAENSNMTEQSSNLVLSQLLDCLEFESKPKSPPKWDFFDNSLMSQIFADCEVKSENGHKILNIRKMHNILYDELCMVQSSIASGQRKLILQEIESVLEFAVQVNDERNKDFATVKMVEAWGHITEILFSCAPDTALTNDNKQELLFEILQKILGKIVPIQPMTEISILTSGTLLLLLVNLRCCYTQKHHNKSINDLQNSNFMNSQLEKQTDKSLASTNKSDTLSLKFILKNILEWIIISGVGSQKLRINLYAALLNCLCIVRGNNNAAEAEEERNEQFVSRLDRTVSTDHVTDIESSHLRMSMEVFMPFGEKLIDILCNDCITGHDVCKMSALSCIDALLELDLMTGAINFIAHRGYLLHITKSLIQTDEDLCRILCEQPDNMRSLYVYESKMAMLLRLASSHVGAELILTDRVMGVLSSMKVFDMHPEYQGMHMQIGRRNKIEDDTRHGFVPSVYTRFAQILFPALNLCDGLISTLGSDNHSVISQVTQFLISHSDMIEMMLRTSTPFMELGLLRELAALTGLIARTTNQEIFVFNANNSNNNLNSEMSVNLFRIQRLVLFLLPRFVVNEATFKDMLKPENICYEPTEANKALHIKYFLEVAANLALYCRNAIYNHAADHRANAIVFTASNPAEGNQRNDNQNKAKSPSLDVVISQLKGTVEYYNKQKTVADHILRQKTSVSNINFDISAKDSQLQLTQRYNEKLNELSLCAFTTEQCLYLLWSHLDFYMRRTVEGTNSFAALDRSYQDTFNSPVATLSSDISALKKNLISIFNETFCKQLLMTSASQSVTDKGFNEALLRRIKSLIQFVPVNC